MTTSLFKTTSARSFVLTGLMTCLLTAAGFAQYTTADEAKEYINDRLSHSVIQKIDPDGTVTVNAPDEKIKFRLNEVSFNYNGGNNDDRVRVFCNDCIAHYEHKVLKETTSRQSFLCESEKEAMEAIAAFRYLKKLFKANAAQAGSGSMKLKVSDSAFNTKTVDEAIDFINENLSYSMITGIDEKGMMAINAPDESYVVNLKKAEFCYNDADDGSKVRIYGDFCIGQRDDDGVIDLISRKSFQTPSRVKAYKAITVLYYLKCTFTDLNPATIPALKNLHAARVSNYSNVAEAIDFINARLSYSVILGVDNAGMMTINAPEDIYRISLPGVKISSAINRKTTSDWFPFVTIDGPSTGILMECRDCLKKYTSPTSYDSLDEQVFQCGSQSQVRELVKAFTYIRNSYKK